MENVSFSRLKSSLDERRLAGGGDEHTSHLCRRHLFERIKRQGKHHQK